MLVSFPGIWLIVKLTPAVSELTLLPAVFKLKLPAVAVGVSPAIKLSEARVHVGVNGKAPCWSDVVMVNCAEAELTNNSNNRNSRLAAILHLSTVCLFTII